MAKVSTSNISPFAILLRATPVDTKVSRNSGMERVSRRFKIKCEQSANNTECSVHSLSLLALVSPTLFILPLFLDTTLLLLIDPFVREEMAYGGRPVYDSDAYDVYRQARLAWLLAREIGNPPLSPRSPSSPL